jgi:hypothetical protein
MAAIDKLYFDSPKEALEFYLWAEMFDDYCIKETQKSLIDCFYMRHWWFTDKELKGFWPCERPIINTPCCIDDWLWNHCPLDFVRKKMEDWWGYSDEDLNNPEFYIERSFDRDQWRKERTIKALKKEIDDNIKWLESDFPQWCNRKDVDKCIKIIQTIKYNKDYYKCISPSDLLSSLVY